jgi:hypothetical protein
MPLLGKVGELVTTYLGLSLENELNAIEKLAGSKDKNMKKLWFVLILETTQILRLTKRVMADNLG